LACGQGGCRRRGLITQARRVVAVVGQLVHAPWRRSRRALGSPAPDETVPDDSDSKRASRQVEKHQQGGQRARAKSRSACSARRTVPEFLLLGGRKRELVFGLGRMIPPGPWPGAGGAWPSRSERDVGDRGSPLRGSGKTGHPLLQGGGCRSARRPPRARQKADERTGVRGRRERTCRRLRAGSVNPVPKRPAVTFVVVLGEAGPYGFVGEVRLPGVLISAVLISPVLLEEQCTQMCGTSAGNVVERGVAVHLCRPTA